jgi:hypothetical protein
MLINEGTTFAEMVREVRFRPFRPGHGPAFTLRLYSGNFGRMATGQERMGYRLTMKKPGERRIVLFEGKDFGRAPGNTEDGAETVVAIMGFLTLKPGDTDPDYFAAYSDVQRDYCERYAESLSVEVQARFCDEKGNVRRGAK